MAIRLRRIESHKTPPFAEADVRTERPGFLSPGRVSVALVLLVAGGAAWFYWQHQWIVTTGRIVSTQLPLGSLAAGRLQALHAREGEAVTQGQLLAEIDAAPLIQAIERERDEASAALERSERLLLLKAVTREQHDRAQAQCRKLEGDLESARAQARILAPRAGILSRVLHQVGEVVAPKDLVLVLADPGETWVEAYVDAKDLSGLGVGQLARVTIEGLAPGKLRAEFVAVYAAPSREGTCPSAPTKLTSPSSCGIASIPYAFVSKDCPPRSAPR